MDQVRNYDGLLVGDNIEKLGDAHIAQLVQCDVLVAQRI
jgi:hypothetical protein